ncbi:hypothetical protein [Jannaschia pohangensis]|uniref:Uncharacterized protein n=1 Tax=Jannaschia pohangensis TaxID=390807 RepID=A0A1I3HPH8_9RHOB|nr:hypothetical protein [Jannaschia pohangensis]SFI37489.1 hypothetical protein SAMN04488095_0669 [Jannaschia pohangensis]
MPDQAEIDSRIARIEAALGAAMAAVAAKADAPDHSAELKAVEAELLVARQRIVTLESEAKEREAALSKAIDRAEAAEATPAAPQADVAALESRIAELTAARAMDLAEMKALLAELEPMLETANA